MFSPGNPATLYVSLVMTVENGWIEVATRVNSIVSQKLFNVGVACKSLPNSSVDKYNDTLQIHNSAWYEWLQTSVKCKNKL